MDDGLPADDVFQQPNPQPAASPLDEIGDIGGQTKPTVQANQPTGTPLDDIGDIGQTETSATGAAVRGAAKSILPAGGALAGAGAGAELGGVVGSTIGPWGTVGGALIGGIAGGIGGQKAVEHAQNWMLSKLPDSFVDAFGQDQKTDRLDQQQHPVASFVGGLVPYAVTMKPGPLLEKSTLPENATALQKLMHNPVTARLFGGGVMGGMELGNELIDHEDLNWRKIGIATAFGTVFNKPNAVGEAITEMGARPARGGRPAPTIAQAGDLKVLGPGITEEVFHGTHEQAPSAAMTAQETARAEAEPVEPDAGAVARQMEPELFSRYDELLKRRETFSAWAGEGPNAVTADQHLAATNAELHALSPEVAAAYRRAADTMGAETIPPPQFKSFAEMLAAREKESGKPEEPIWYQGVWHGAGDKPTSDYWTTDLDLAREYSGANGHVFAARESSFPSASLATRQGKVLSNKEFRPGEPYKIPEIETLGRLPRSASNEEFAALSRKGTMDEAQVPVVPQEAAAEGAAVPGVQPVSQGGGEQVGVNGPEGVAGPGNARPARSIGDQRVFIANDVERRLIAAGRPEDEAKAAGQIIAARYVTRADRFEGKLGSAEELYARESADIAGRQGKSIQPGQHEPETAVKAPVSRGRAAVSPEKWSLFEVLAHEGGLKPDPELEAIFGNKAGPFVPGFGKLLRQTGRSLDDALRLAKDKGYLFDPSDLSGATPTLTPRDLLDRLSEENSGRKQYKTNHVEPEKTTPEKERDSVVATLQAELAKNGDTNPVDPVLGDRVAELIAQGKEADVMSAYERAIMEERDLYEAAQNQPELAQDITEFFQTARGTIRLSPGQRPIISLLKDANASTFIHESGHQFLEELQRDAAHAEAPDVVKQDFETVQKWLGVGEKGIETKHHEKFARGFEQYMREGVAPSKALAGVFAQFRDWLLSIYQSIKGLGKEISPEIRDVFDRMLEMEPQRTVVAPERAQPDLLHDIHEAEGNHTEPHEAEAAHDRIVAESNQYLADQPKDIQNELQAAVGRVQEVHVEGVPEEEPGTGAVGGQAIPSGAGAQPVVEGRPGSEPEPGGGAGGKEHGEEQPGGLPTGGEGANAQAGPDLRSKLGDQPGTALAPGPVDLLGARESPLVDKAGNIRLDNLNVPEDVAQAIRVAARENNEFIGDRRGVITDGQVLELADALGMDAESLNKRQLGQAFNAEQIVAARKLLIQSATRVSGAMKKAAEGTDADVLAYAQAKDRHQMIQAHVAGITAEAGRALRAFRSMAGMEEAQAVGDFLQQATGKTLFQLKAEAKLGAQLQTPGQVSKFMHDAQKRTFGRMVLEYWINGLISGPATHMTYAVGNTISSLLRIPENLAAAGVARAASALGREGGSVRPGEALEMARAAVRELPSAIKASIGGAETGLTTQLPGETAAQGTLFQGDAMGAPAQFHEGATYHDAVGAAFGVVRGMRDGIVAAGKLLAAGGVHGEPLVGAQYSPLGAIPDITLRGVNVLPVGSVVRAPGRFIAAIHSFYRSVNFSMEKAALAYRKAAEEGLEGEALAARVAQIRADPSEATMNEIAVHQATQTVLMGKGSELTQALSRLTNAKVFGFPLLKFIDPFVHISGNIIEQAVLQRTPVGLLSMLGPETEFARDLTGKNGNASQDKAIGRMMVGTALSVGFGSLAAQGLMSGSGPKDPRESAMWRLAGNQAHSVRIGDIWYDVHKLGPLGMLAGISADLFDVAHEAEQGEFLKAAAHLQHAFAQNILDESFMRGPAELMQAIEDPGRFGESYIRNFLSSFVPFSVGMSQIARAQDPYTRRAQTVTDAIKAKIPGLSQSLLPRRDIWGEPIPSREVLGAPGVSAIYETRMNRDPVNQAMMQLNIFPGAVEKKIRNVELNPQEYDDFSRIAGRMAKANLDKIVRSPSWEQIPVEGRHAAVEWAMKSSRETARNMIIAKYPHIAREGAEIKQQKARGEKPK